MKMNWKSINRRRMELALVAGMVSSLLVATTWVVAQDAKSGPATATAEAKPAAEAKKTTTPIAIAPTSVTKGQRIVTTTHSFNVYVFQGGRGGAGGGSPLARLAEEGGFKGQEQVQLQMIGNSNVGQHWARGGDTGPVKVALRGGNIDVLTFAPHRIMPEEAIDQFADLAVKHNPNIRILAQMSWNSWDGQGTVNSGNGFKNTDRNKTTKEDLKGEKYAVAAEEYAVRLRKQFSEINERHGRSICYVVPVSYAVIQLRDAVIDGKVPGVTQQSELFSDDMGHPGRNNVLSNLVEYTWYAVMYGKSPVGLKTFVKEGDADSAKLHKLLQEIALDVVTKEPMSGFPKEAAKATASLTTTPAVLETK